MPALTDDQLAAWKQLQWATALITSRFRRDLAAAGLSLEQFDVLVHLAWAPSGTLPLHELTASMVVAGQHRFDQVWPAHADGIGRYFAQPLAPRDIGELARILDSLIQANQNHDQPG
jgi:hypothetical protein